MNTTVTNIRRRTSELGPSLEYAPDLTYVGKANARGRARRGWDLRQHALHNPHTVGDEGSVPRPCRVRACAGAVHSREEAVSLYCRHLLDKPGLLRLVPALNGRVLACWCAPQLCHAHILAALADAPLEEHRRLLEAFVVDPWAALPSEARTPV